ncbi:MAG: hypothetical protein RXR02_10605, partial [Thermoproteus sp.]
MPPLIPRLGVRRVGKTSVLRKSDLMKRSNRKAQRFSAAGVNVLNSRIGASVRSGRLDIAGPIALSSPRRRVGTGE